MRFDDTEKSIIYLAILAVIIALFFLLYLFGGMAGFSLALVNVLIIVFLVIAYHSIVDLKKISVIIMTCSVLIIVLYFAVGSFWGPISLFTIDIFALMLVLADKIVNDKPVTKSYNASGKFTFETNIATPSTEKTQPVQYFENEKKTRFEPDIIYHDEKSFVCSECKRPITKGVSKFSIDMYNKPLCRIHQNGKKVTRPAQRFYDALRSRGVNCILEAPDGHKHVDISIPEAKIYVEIDGEHHLTDPKQMEADFERDHYSHNDGYDTRRYTNKQINENLDKFADALAEVVRRRKNKFQSNGF
jgi:very-short-patch-repair endonuclease